MSIEALRARLAAAGTRVASATTELPTTQVEATPPLSIKTGADSIASLASSHEPVQEGKELSVIERIRLKTQQTQVVKAAEPKKEDRVPTVITAANLAAKGVVANDKDANKSADAGIDIEFIRQKIAELENYDGGTIKGAMDNLSEMIMANPAACATMLPQDIGAMVKQLYRMTDNKVAMEMSTARGSKTAKVSDKITAADVKAALEEDWD